MEKRIIKSASLVAILILVSDLPYLLLGNSWYSIPSGIRITINMLFPLEVIAELKYILFYNSRFMAFYPVFNYLFVIFLFIGIAAYTNKQYISPLIIACAILFLSILINIPFAIKEYLDMLRDWKNYKPSDRSGLLDLINSFSHKEPSLMLLIVHIVILLVYAAWSIWMMKNLSNTKKPVVNN
jgi:hypothetical protein